MTVDKFWELLEQSVLVSGAVAIMLCGTMCYLAIAGKPVPELLGYAVSGVVSFFFGAKMQKEASARAFRRVG